MYVPLWFLVAFGFCLFVLYRFGTMEVIMGLSKSGWDEVVRIEVDWSKLSGKQEVRNWNQKL